MSFYGARQDAFSNCDKCKKEATAERPVLRLVQSAGRGCRREYREIRVHFDCLEKIIKREALPEFNK